MNMKPRNLSPLHSFCALFCCGLLTTTPPVAAQEEIEDKSTLMIEEIIVTAERRAEGIQRVPIAVTAFTGEEIRAKGIDQIEEIALRTPSFIFDSQDQAEPNLYIRGIGSQNGDHPVNETPIAVYIDDVYISRSSGSNFDLFDLERVEVLRGPQGTLFGRNASGGVMHLITSKPQAEFGARGQVTVGNFNKIDIRAMVTGPLTDSVYFKLVASSKNRDGYVLNETTGNDVADEQSTSLRAGLRFVPNDDLEINLSSDYVRERGTSSAHDTEFAPGVIGFSNPKPRIVNALDDGIRERDLFSMTLRFDYNLNWAQLVSITAYRDVDYFGNWYFAGNPLNDDTIESFNTNIEDSQQFSQEFRLSGSSDRLDWVTGLYYFDVNVDKTESFGQHFNGLFKALGLPESLWGMGNGNNDFITEAETESWAIFGQGTYKITDKLGLTAGLRYTDDTRKFITDAVITDGTAPIGLNEEYLVDIKKGWDAVTPKLALEYQATDDALVYLSATKGWKSGTFNHISATGALAQTALNPEEVWSYELGAKTQWFDNRMRLNATVFYMDVTDLQIASLIAGEAIVVESATGEIKGFELEFLTVPIEGLELQANYSYLDAKINEGSNAGNDLPRSPTNKINLSGSYDMPISDRVIMSVRADWTYQSSFFHEPDNRLSEVQGSYDMLDARIDFLDTQGRYRVSIWGKNLNDELVTRSQVAVAAIGQNFVTYAPPRTYGVTFTWNY